MKALLTIGCALVLAGIVLLINGGFSFTEMKKDTRLDYIHMLRPSERGSFPKVPVIAGALILGGLGLAILGARAED